MRFLLNGWIGLLIGVAMGLGVAYAVGPVLWSETVSVNVTTPEPTASATEEGPGAAEQLQVQGPQQTSQTVEVGQTATFGLTYSPAGYFPDCNVIAPSFVNAGCRVQASSILVMLRPDEAQDFEATIELSAPGD